MRIQEAEANTSTPSALGQRVESVIISPGPSASYWDSPKFAPETPAVGGEGTGELSKARGTDERDGRRGPGQAPALQRGTRWPQNHPHPKFRLKEHPGLPRSLKS